MATEPGVAPSSGLARSAGFFYLLTIVTGILALQMSGDLLVLDDAASTSANIRSNENLFRAGFVANALMTASYIVVTALFYRLSQHTSRTLSLTAACFSLVGCAMMAVSLLSYPTLLLILDTSASTFSAEQIQSLALFAFRIFQSAYDTGLFFFGVYCLLIGLLIIRSGFIPRAVGLLMAFAGLGWITYLWPPLAATLEPYNLLPGLIGEGALALWLMVKGAGVTANNSFKPTPLRGAA